jgi:SanA protein
MRRFLRAKNVGKLAIVVVALVGALNVVVLVRGSSASSSAAAAAADAAAAAPEPSASRADCILVLGAGVQEDGTPSWVLHDRLSEALVLYKAGRAKKILVSGDHHTGHYDEPNAMRVWLEAHDVPSEDIFMDHAGVDTYSSMWRAKNIFQAKSIVVVTQRFHLPRAVFLARALGMKAEGSAADRRMYRGAAWFQVREIASRTKAFIDVSVGRTPHHVGPPIPLENGDGRVTAG